MDQGEWGWGGSPGERGGGVVTSFWAGINALIFQNPGPTPARGPAVGPRPVRRGLFRAGARPPPAASQGPPASSHPPSPLTCCCPLLGQATRLLGSLGSRCPPVAASRRCQSKSSAVGASPPTHPQRLALGRGAGLRRLLHRGPAVALLAVLPLLEPRARASPGGRGPEPWERNQQPPGLCGAQGAELLLWVQSPMGHTAPCWWPLVSPQCGARELPSLAGLPKAPGLVHKALARGSGLVHTPGGGSVTKWDCS